VSPGGFIRTNFGSFDEISINYTVQSGNIDFGSFFNEASPPAAQVMPDSITSLEDGAFIFLSRPPFSDGVQVKIGNETLSATYGSEATGNTFGIGLSQAGRSSGTFSLRIQGLSGNTVYQAKIAAFNKNGVGASVTIAFKTGNNFDFAL
jgi:hypothetical protein